MPLLDNLMLDDRTAGRLSARIHALHAAVAEAGGRRYDRYLTRAESDEACEQVLKRAGELEAWLLRDDTGAPEAPLAPSRPVGVDR